MTMLYRLDATARQIADCFGARAGEDPWEGGYVAPGKFAPVITAGREFVAGPRPSGRAQRRMIPRLWGVPPPPSATRAPREGIATVRNPDSPFWIGNLRNSEFRCIVPATAFMEWHKGRDTEEAQAGLVCDRRPAGLRLRRRVEGQRSAKHGAAYLRTQRGDARSRAGQHAGDPARRSESTGPVAQRFLGQGEQADRALSFIDDAGTRRGVKPQISRSGTFPARRKPARTAW